MAKQQEEIKPGRKAHPKHPGIQVVTRKDGSTRYMAEVFIKRMEHPVSGKMFNKYERETCATLGGALDWRANHRVTQLKDPLAHVRAKDAVSFPDLVKLWRSTTYVGLRPNSRDRADQVLRAHLIPEFADDTTRTLDRERISVYFGGLRGRGDLSLGTVKKVHGVLSSILSAAVEFNKMDANPALRLKVLRKAASRKRPLVITPAEVKALADAIGAKHAPYGTAVLVAGFTGLRASELWELRRGDIDLIKGEITVSRAIKEWKDGEAVPGPTKTDKPRTVSLAPEVGEALAAHLASLPGGDDVLVFSTMTKPGKAVKHLYFYRRHFVPTVEKVLPQRTALVFHDLRHAFVSMLIAGGLDPVAVAEQAGHASPKMTLDVYGHLYEDHEDRARSAISAAFKSATADNVVSLDARRSA